MFTERGMELSDVDKQFMRKLKNGYLISMDNLAKLLALVLGDCFWCKLMSPVSDFLIEFGYDLYIYITCNELEERVIQQAEKLEMYIEDI